LREEAEEKVGVIQPIVVVEVAAGGRLVEVVGMWVQKKVVVVLPLRSCCRCCWDEKREEVVIGTQTSSRE
jgi:hypothetical protein